MADINVNAIIERITAIDAELPSLQRAGKEHQRLSEKANADYFALKQERQELNKTLAHNQVVVAVQNAQAAAAAAQKQAEQTAKDAEQRAKESDERIAAKEAEVDAMLAKLKAAAEKATEKVEQPEPGKGE